MKRKFKYDNSKYEPTFPDGFIELLCGKFDLDGVEITADSTGLSLGLDSLDFVELLMEVERYYGISIPDEDAENCRNMRDFLNIINPLIAKTDGKNKKCNAVFQIV